MNMHEVLVTAIVDKSCNLRKCVLGQFRSKTLDFKWILSVVLVPNPAACVPGEQPPPKPPLLGLGLDLESPKDRTTEQQNSH